MKLKFIILNLLFLLKFTTSTKQKNIADLTDAEIERLYEQWEENDEDKLAEDEKPAYLQDPPKLKLDDVKGKTPEDITRLNKKGRSLMIFMTVSGNPIRDETERITALWQSSLYNANYELSRYLIEDNRAIFMVKDGSLAWDIKDFLIKQDRCLEVTIENEKFPGLNLKKKSDL